MWNGYVRTMGDGTAKTLSRGFFVFPIETFAPTAELNLVLVGQSGETTCTIDRRRLASLR